MPQALSAQELWICCLGHPREKHPRPDTGHQEPDRHKARFTTVQLSSRDPSIQLSHGHRELQPRGQVHVASPQEAGPVQTSHAWLVPQERSSCPI